MQIFNISVLEVFLILVVMIIVLGPNQVVDFAAKLGRFIRKITRSEFWTTVRDTSREIRNLPKALVEETGLEESITDIKQTSSELSQEMNNVQTDINQEASVQLKEFEKTTDDLRDAGQELKKRTGGAKLSTEKKPPVLEKPNPQRK